MLKKAIVLAILGILLISTAIYASYEWQFPITVTDTSNTAHTYYPIDLGFGTDALVTAGKLDANGLDSNLQEGATSLAFMNATSRVMGVLPSLPALEGRTVDYYTGFAPAQTSTEIVVGQDGYVTTLDNADLEPTDSFDLTMSLYTLGTGAGTIFEKNHALEMSYSGETLTVLVGDDAAPDITLTTVGATTGEHTIEIVTETGTVVPADIGELGNAFIDTEDEITETWFSSTTQISEDVWAFVCTESNSTLIYTYTIDDDTGAITSAVIDSVSLSSPFSSSVTPKLIRVHGDIYALFYGLNDGNERIKIGTIGITSSGSIDAGLVASLLITEVARFNFDDPILINDTGVATIIAFSVSEQLRTVSISYDGLTISVVDTEAVGTSNNYSWLVMEHVSGDIYALVNGQNSGHPYLYTYEITTAGAISSVDSLELNTNNQDNFSTNLIKVGSGVYLTYYYDSTTANGVLKTIGIADNGTIGAPIDTDTGYDLLASPIISMGGAAYMLPLRNGTITTITVSEAGTIGATIDTLATGSGTSLRLEMLNEPSATTNYLVTYKVGLNDHKLRTFTGVSMLGTGTYTNLCLYLDSILKDSEEMLAIIPDNSNNWIWYPNPYINYIKLETSN